MSWFTSTSMGKFVNTILFGLPGIIEGLTSSARNSDGSSNTAFGFFNRQNWKNTFGDIALGDDYDNNQPLGQQLFGTNLGGLFKALTNRITAEHLTGAEREANDFNAAQAQLDRDFQERMSNTQYQRGVADMRAAGVNPALAMSNGGASAPAGVSASSAQPQGSAFDIGSLIQLLMLKPQKDLMKKQGDAAIINAEAAKEQAAAASENAGTNRTRLLTVEQPLAENKIAVGKSVISMNEARTKQIGIECDQLAQDIELTKLHRIATALNIQWQTETWENNKQLLISQIAKNISSAALDRAASTEKLSLAALHDIDVDIKQKDKFVASAIQQYLENLPGDGWIQSELNSGKSWHGLLHGYGTGLLDGLVKDFKEDYGAWTWDRFIHGEHGGVR